MSERMTSISAPPGLGLADYGRKTRAEMIRQYRAYFKHQKAEAETALAFTDDELVVETYLGPFAQRNKEVVR